MDAPEMIAAELERIATLIRQSCAGPEVQTISVGEAAFIADISEAQMRKLCRENRYDKGGYAFRGGGRWRIVVVPFIQSLRVSALTRVK